MNATISAMLNWWNLLFLVPIVLAGLLLLLSAVTGLGDTDIEADVASSDTEADTDTDSETDGSSLSDTLRSLGVGVVPVSLLLQAFLLFFGVWGLTANRFLNVDVYPELRIWLALPLALIGGAATTALFGAVARRFFPTEEAAPTSGNDLIARSGRVVFTVTEQGGTVQVRDAGGTLHQVSAGIAPGADPIPAGRMVLLLAKDKETGHFLVEESPFTE